MRRFLTRYGNKKRFAIYQFAIRTKNSPLVWFSSPKIKILGGIKLHLICKHLE